MKLSGVTAGALAGATCLEKGETGSTSGKKKRSLSRYTYTISIDDSTEKIIISVVTKKMSPTITLKNPSGHSVTSGKIYLSRGLYTKSTTPRQELGN